MTTYQTARKTCTICKKVSYLDSVKSTSYSGSTSLDFRPPAMKQEVIKYWVQQCAFCGYVAEDISKVSNLPDSTIMEENYLNTGIDFPKAIEKLLKVAYLESVKKSPKKALEYTLGAAWLCDDIGNTTLAQKIRELALERFDQCGDCKQYTDQLLYIDLLRRTSKFKACLALLVSIDYEKESMVSKIICFQMNLCLSEDTKSYTVKDAADYYQKTIQLNKENINNIKLKAQETFKKNRKSK